MTGRASADSLLRASERRFRALLERGQELVTLVDAAGNVVTESPNMAAILGHPVGSMVGRNILSLAHPDDRLAAESTFRELASTPGTSRRLEARTQRRDGQWVWLETVGTNLLDDPDMHSIVLHSRDITERKAVRESLRESETRLRLALQAVRAGTYSFDVENGRLTCDETYRTNYGFAMDEPLSFERWVEHLHEADRERVLVKAKEAISPRGPMLWIEEFRVRHPSGEDCWIADFGRVERASDGRAIRVTGINLDITQRKQNEHLLSVESQRSRQIIESIPMLAWQCNEKGEAQYCNRRWYEYTGEGAEKTLGDMWQKALHPDDEQRIRDETIRTAATGDPYNVEYRLRRHDGEYRWHLARALPVRDADGKITMWVGCAADIEDSKRAEATLRDSAARLEQRVAERTAALKRESQLRAKLEHQLLLASEREQRRIGQDLHDGLGQRLVAIRFLTASMGKRLGQEHDDSSLSEVAQIHDELGQAIEELRAVARGLHPVRHEPEGLMSALAELSQTTERVFNVACLFQCPEPVLVRDFVAASHLYRIAQEAVGNAVKHAYANQVVIHLERGGPSLRLEVRDDGRGLPAVAQQAPGLGLSSMRYRAELIGATFSVGSVRNGGTVVACVWAPTNKDHLGGNNVQ
jgi:PAS domain S-box-containing protein